MRTAAALYSGIFRKSTDKRYLGVAVGQGQSTVVFKKNHTLLGNFCCFFVVYTTVKCMLSSLYVTVAVNLLKYTLYGCIKHLFIKCAVLYRLDDLCIVQAVA